jgi:Undecaprenyl-phosphate glucose phosphotransferase
MRRSGRLIPNIVVVGATENAERLIERALASREVSVLGVFDDRKGRAPDTVRGVPLLGDTRALVGHRIMPYVDRIVITVSASAQSRVRDLVDKLRGLPNEITLFVDLGEADTESATLSRLCDLPLARLSGYRADGRRAFVKRAQDLVIGAIAMIVAAPLMAAVALAIRLDSPGPILFRQRRQGFNNEEIVVLKFRSMRHDRRDERAERQVSDGDDRVTRVGRFIRRTSLDELPQILNVLKGEMSLVGPRPHSPTMKTGDVESIRLVAEYAHRHRTKPGMTGWAAIQGSRGPLDTPEKVRRRVALDIDYIERQSFWFDLYIIAITLPCLLGDRQGPR